METTSGTGLNSFMVTIGGAKKQFTTVTASVLTALLPHALFALTVMLPLLVPILTTMFVEPWPKVI